MQFSDCRFFELFMPYCIEQQGNSDQYLIMNKHRDILCVWSDSGQRWSRNPLTSFTIKGLTKAVVKRLSVDPDSDTKSFYLYKLGSMHPMLSKQEMDAYLRRLKTLYKLRLEWSPQESGSTQESLNFHDS